MKKKIGKQYDHKYTCAVAIYYKGNVDNITHGSYAIIDLETDEMVDNKVVNTKKVSMEEFTDLLMEKTTEYDDVPIMLIDPVPFEKCSCCNDPVIRVLDRRAMIAGGHRGKYLSKIAKEQLN